MKDNIQFSQTIEDIRGKAIANPGTEIVSSERSGLSSLNTLGNGIAFLSWGPSSDPKDPNVFTDAEKYGALGQVTKVMTSLYDNPPASTYAYIQDLMANSGIIPVSKVQAQGIGFVGLMPLLPLWKASRNLAYGIIILVMLAIGFMIIFRMKIDPKTVISVQAALPKIVLTLILITFSYPIAGFLIDMMYVVSAIIISLMANAAKGAGNIMPGAGFITDAPSQQAEFLTGGLGGWGKLFNSIFSLGMVPSALSQFFLGSFTNSLTAGGTSLAGGVIGKLALQLPFFKAALATAVILVVIVALGLLFTFIRLTMLLFNSYVQLLITVILAPILLLQEAIPGQSAFAQWIQNIIANLVVFPATIAIIYFSWIVTAISWNSNLWAAPLIPTGGGGDIKNGNPMAVFLGIGIIFLAPSLVASVKKMFHPKPALPITAGTAFAPATGAAGTLMGAGSQFYYFKSLMDSFGQQKKH